MAGDRCERAYTAPRCPAPRGAPYGVNMWDAFLNWTTELNRTQPLAFALVTVATMASIGVAIAVTAEVLLTRLSPRSSGAPADSHGPH